MQTFRKLKQSLKYIGIKYEKFAFDVEVEKINFPAGSLTGSVLSVSIERCVTNTKMYFSLMCTHFFNKQRRVKKIDDPAFEMRRVLEL